MKKTLFILSLMFSPAIAAAADAAPVCNAENVGKTQCMSQKECVCTFFRKSEMAGTPDRFGWDCGILRPTCLDYQNIDSTKPYDGPSSVIIDKSATQTH